MNPGLADLVRYDLRREQLCKSIRGCPEADTVRCRNCSTLRIPPDIVAPDVCPACGESLFNRERCEACPILWLEQAMDSAAGELLRRAVIIDDALQMEFTVTMADVTAEEFTALRVINRERSKKQKEDEERMRQDQELRRARSRMHG